MPGGSCSTDVVVKEANEGKGEVLSQDGEGFYL